MRSTCLALAILLPTLAPAAAPCAHTVAELRALMGDAAFPLNWEETSMADARPLVVTLDERPGGLFISFVKTGEGLWAEGLASLCRSGERLEARFGAGQLHIGPAPGWLLRQALQGGAGIALQRVTPQELRIGTVGWTGSFVPVSARLGLKAP
jgi:hypothetical protein